MRSTFADSYLPTVSVSAIYNQLEDDESREIFLWRYQFYKTRNHKKFLADLMDSGNDCINRHIWRRMHRKSDLIAKSMFRKARETGAILFGAGFFLRNYIVLLKWLDIDINAICDTHKQGKMHGEYPILTVEEAVSHHSGAVVFITPSNVRYQMEMRQSLLRQGVDNNLIFVESDFLKHLYDDIDFTTLHNYKQYFDPQIIQPKPNEVYIDAGSNTGDTILKFIKWNAGDYKRIYGFEPEPGLFDHMNNTIKDNSIGNTVVFRKGLWDTADTLRFSAGTDIGDAKIIESGESTIETITLDDAVNPDDRVTFIKMDIEGSELNALYGARNIIRRDKPRLAICVYHKPDDIVDILSYVISLSPDYKLYLRHYSAASENETVLYAI